MSRVLVITALETSGSSSFGKSVPSMTIRIIVMLAPLSASADAPHQLHPSGIAGPSA